MTKTTKKTSLPKTRKNYKDTMFRMLFNEKERLLSLYNAIRGTNYTNTEKLEIVTLENAIYLNMQNDLAFVIDRSLNLYEHQSTCNPNMPLRNLFYVSKELSMLVDADTLYWQKLVKIPFPRFIVFYNGTKEEPEQKFLKLSDSFEYLDDAPELELIVTVLNINLGKNKQLLERCRTLREYMIFVTKIRKYTAKTPLDQAVEETVQECINEGILKDFLLKNRKEVIEVCIFEYNEERVMQAIRQDEFARGKEAGIEFGITQGETRILLLYQKLLSDNRTDDFNKATDDIEYRNKLYAEYCI